jgi:hypothetical protein
MTILHGHYSDIVMDKKTVEEYIRMNMEMYRHRMDRHGRQ